jgi:hypothetical protein
VAITLCPVHRGVSTPVTSRLPYHAPRPPLLPRPPALPKFHGTPGPSAARAGRASGGQVMTLFHGTSMENAERIQACGFEESTKGKLGPGVYFASYTKVGWYPLQPMHMCRHQVHPLRDLRWWCVVAPAIRVVGRPSHLPVTSPPPQSSPLWCSLIPTHLTPWCTGEQARNFARDADERKKGRGQAIVTAKVTVRPGSCRASHPGANLDETLEWCIDLFTGVSNQAQPLTTTHTLPPAEPACHVCPGSVPPGLSPRNHQGFQRSLVGLHSPVSHLPPHPLPPDQRPRVQVRVAHVGQPT